MVTILIIFSTLILFNFLLLKFSCNNENKKVKKTKHVSVKKEANFTLNIHKRDKSIEPSSLKASL